MNNNNNKPQFNNLNLVWICALVWASKLVKFSFIVGSIRAFFSLVNVSGPLAVVFSGWSGGLLGLFLTYALQAKSNFLLSSLLTSSGIPNLLAGLYWRASANWFKIGLPSLCMCLFWYQTWGTIAMAYALLWLIPILITLFKIEQIYLKALAATFIAHSVGSVVWVYAAHLTPEQWWALIPVALCERVFLAILMGLVYNLGQYCSTLGLFHSKTNRQLESVSL